MTNRTTRILATMAVLLLGLMLAGAAAADHTANPTSVTIAGDLQSEITANTCGDWDPACAATHLIYDATDDVWQGTFSVPAGNYAYKAALNDSWDESYGKNTGSDNILLAAPGGNVKFYYDHKTHWITDNINSRIVTAAGNFQSELGCSDDWQPDCLRSWLQDPDGNGTYTFVTEDIPGGNYEGKAAIGEGWDESYPGGNYAFSVPNDCSTTTFTFVSASNTFGVDSVAGECGHGNDNNVEFDGLGHNSHDTLYRVPFGARCV